MLKDVDLFAGPGGWEEGAVTHGITPLGLELDADACATALAAGHKREQVDVSAAEPTDYGPVRGLIGSPPCQGFSITGSGRGRADSLLILDRLSHVTTRDDLEAEMAGLHRHMSDDRSLLALEPLRWALALRPEWTVWEQVPLVLPLWEAAAIVLRHAGYSTAHGFLHAEQYGVPQTRKRAVLIAHRDRRATLPTPSHSQFHTRTPHRLDLGVEPWVPLGEALGWAPGTGTVQRSNYSNGSKYPTAAERGRTIRRGDQPSVVITGRTFQWESPSGRRHATVPEAGVLQTFPIDYPWQGDATSRKQQVGNAIPPRMASAILAEVTRP